MTKTELETFAQGTLCHLNSLIMSLFVRGRLTVTVAMYIYKIGT